ncbi:MAG TPA: TonB-dependent receptor plug domain-containing protein, partial [Rhodocyclaceae bacterium]|nr:TonB-dependent receptor plug domain-containing protein [Rhodocyclaceae bacterium]
MSRPARFALRPLAILIALAPFAASAEDAKLNPVVVSAQKDEQPATAAAVDSAAVAAARASTSDAASLLRDVPGVSLYGAGGVSSLPAIHGLADDRLRIKVDGMDLISACPNHMNSPLSYIDPTSVGAVKVYAGIAPVSVGGDSIGGSVVMDSTAPTFAAPGQGSLFKGEIGAFYRSNGDGKGANLSATYATEAFSINYAASSAKADDYKAGGDFKNFTATKNGAGTLPLDEVGSTAYDTRNQALGLALKGDRDLVEIKFGYQDIPYELYPNQRMDMLANTEHSVNLHYLGQRDWGTLEARAYHQTIDHYMDFGSDKEYWYSKSPLPAGYPCSLADPTKCANGMPMDTHSTTGGASVNASIDLAQQGVLRIGGEYQHYTLNDWWPASGLGMYPNTFQNISDGKRDRAGLFGEWEATWSPQWHSLAGIRVEHVTTDTGTVQGYSTANYKTSSVGTLAA